MIPGDLLYTEEHEWIRVEGETATIGITDYATEELGEIVYVDLPEVGANIEQLDEFGTVESVKTLSSLYMPVAGKVTHINETLAEEPGQLNDAPFEGGWLVKVKVKDTSEYNNLLSPSDYQSFLESL